MVKIESILGEAYGLRIKKSKKYKHPCYIGEILNEKCLEAIGAHSISRGNNLDNHTWYTFQHDPNNLKNKFFMLDEKILKPISKDNASVTHTICLNHDKQFHIFEGDNNIEINDTYQLNLLNIRTFINFYFNAINSKNELLLKKEFLEKKLVAISNKQDIKKLKIALRNIKNRIKENEVFINKRQLLEYLIEEYWNFLHKNEEIEDGFYNTSFLTEEMNFLVLPLENDPLIVGSFLMQTKFLKNHLNYSEHQLEELIGSELDFFEDEQQEEIYRKMDSYGDNSAFIIFHILKNKNQPCIIIQAYDHSEDIACLFNLFMKLRDDPIKLTSLITSIIIRNPNVFYRSELIDSLSVKEKTQLTKINNKKKISYLNKFINKLSQHFKLKKDESILYLKGKSYKHIRLIEEKASVKILSINNVSDLYDDYLSLHYLLGNNDYHIDKICVCNEFGEAGGRGYAENQTIFWILNEYENYIGAIENEESKGNFEYSKEDWDKMLNQKIKNLFNSNVGDIYYCFFESLPGFIELLLEEYPDGFYLEDLKKFIQKQCDINKINIDII